MPKEKTEEEIKAERISNAKRTLDSDAYFLTAGANYALSNQSEIGTRGVYHNQEQYGKLGGQKEFQEAFTNLLRENQQLGVYGAPAYTEVSKSILKQLREAETIVTIGDLEEIVKNKGGKLTPVPEEFKGINIGELIQKMYSGKAEELDSEAFRIYQTLNKAYSVTGAYKGFNPLAEEDGFFKALAEKYKKEEDDKKKKK